MSKFFSNLLFTRPWWILGLSLVLVSNVVLAEPAINEDLLGMSEPALREAFVAAHKVAKPQRGPRGERGLWQLPNSNLEGINFETIFYFKQGALGRIEQRWASLDNGCDANDAAVLSNLNVKYGAAVSSNGVDNAGDQNQFSAWTMEKFQVMAYNIHHQELCEIRIAFKPNQQMDASQL
ncbi:MAG: hypothetical protein PSV24_12325 [Rhodoferax sp.]|nr:hypothetical protein [Rhodoferax sp.]